VLAPAYDMNAVETGDGLKLNISESDNSQSLELAYSVASLYRVKARQAKQIAGAVTDAVSHWREAASSVGIPKVEQEGMRNAFRTTEAVLRPRD
jgi:serine/threonine-protein kinase HipA